MWKGCRWTNKRRLVTMEDTFGVIYDYDKKVSVKVKNKLYITVVISAMVYGSECWALREQDEQRLNTT